MFGQFLFEEGYAKQVPLMAERMLDLPIGGVDDMAVWTGFVWERIARWLDNGPPAHPEPRVPAAPEEEEEEGKDGGSWMRRFIRICRKSSIFADKAKVLELLRAASSSGSPSSNDPAETQQRLAAMSGEKDRCVRKWRC